MNIDNNLILIKGEDNIYRRISMDEAVTMMEKESGYIILDVRTPAEFAEKHIPNAINIPNENIGTDEISALPDKDQLIMVYHPNASPLKIITEQLANKANILRNNRKSCDMNQHLFKKL